MWSCDFQQECKDHSMSKGQSFQQMVLGKLDIPMQKNEIGPFPSPICKIISNMIKDLKVRTKTVQFPEENLGEELHWIGQ